MLLINCAAMLINTNWCIQEQREKVPAERDPCSASASGEPAGTARCCSTPSPARSHRPVPASLSSLESYWLLQPFPCTRRGEKNNPSLGTAKPSRSPKTARRWMERQGVFISFPAPWGGRKNYALPVLSDKTYCRLQETISWRGKCAL